MTWAELLALYVAPAVVVIALTLLAWCDRYSTVPDRTMARVVILAWAWPVVVVIFSVKAARALWRTADFGNKN